MKIKLEVFFAVFEAFLQNKLAKKPEKAYFHLICDYHFIIEQIPKGYPRSLTVNQKKSFHSPNLNPLIVPIESEKASETIKIKK